MARDQIVARNLCLEHGVGTLDDHSLLKQVQHYGVEGRMLSRVGTALTSILIGGAEPLNSMLESDLFYKFYASDSLYTRRTSPLPLQRGLLDILEHLSWYSSMS